MQQDVDPFTLEILNNAFRAVADEMAVIEYRSSFSPVIREELDFDTVVLDADGNLVAASEQIPSMLAVMESSLHRILARRGAPLGPGDAMIANDPYQGGSHTVDVQIFTPAYVGDQLIGYTGAIAHHVDVGGRFPGTENPETTSIYQEGLILPGVLLEEGGRRNEALYEVIKANVRDPRATMGDLAAQLSACRAGGRQLADLCERFGADRVRSAMAVILDRTAEQARRVFSSWDGLVGTAEGFLDNGGPHSLEPRRIAVSAHTEAGTLILDLAGTAEQVDVGLNVPFGSTLASLYYAVREITGLPVNAGLSRQIEIRAPEGSLVNPVFPAPVVARHMAQQRLASTAVEALGLLNPEAAVAASSVCTAVLLMSAYDPRVGRSRMFTDYFGGGGGARPDAPGDNVIDTYTANCAMVPVEVTESEFPWRIERSELVPESRGAGRFPGGMGLRRDFRMLVDRAEGTCYIDQTTEVGRAHGMDGGEPGAPASWTVTRARTGMVERLSGKETLVMERDDVLSLVTSGGGGYGSPSPAVPQENAWRIAEPAAMG